MTNLYGPWATAFVVGQNRQLRRYQLLPAVLLLLGFARIGYGMSDERFGPDKDQNATVEQPGWPAGVVKVLGHDSRVYSIGVNGGENFYFKASPEQINELIKLYCAARLRDHVVFVKNEKVEVKTFKGDKVDYNVELNFLNGIALFFAREKADAETHEPTLTIYVDQHADREFWKKITLPDNVILNNEVADCPWKSNVIKPRRKVWFARVHFDGTTPAADFDHGVSTNVMLWVENAKEGIPLGQVDSEGLFYAAFSEKEIVYLKMNKSWLTLTVGNWLAKAKKDDPKLSVEYLSDDKQKLQPVTIAKPEFYYGRILFEDGSPPFLVPAPWPNAMIEVDFPYAGQGHLDADGYFKVFFSKEQYDDLKAQKTRKNIYIPSYKEKNSSTALYEFSVSKLSRDKKEAVVVRIPKPGP